VRQAVGFLGDRYPVGVFCLSIRALREKQPDNVEMAVPDSQRQWRSAMYVSCFQRSAMRQQKPDHSRVVIGSGVMQGRVVDLIELTRESSLPRSPSSLPP